MPYIDPIAAHGNEIALEPVDIAKPALVYLPSQPTTEEWGPILSVTKGGIGLSGSAAFGMIGPVLGKMDICESDNSYLFRVSLPGVARGETMLPCPFKLETFITFYLLFLFVF